MKTISQFGLLLAAVVPSTPGSVLVVDGFGQGDFIDVQPAVDAAQDGDTILVRNGAYSGFVVAGKGLTVVAQFAASVAGPVRVHHVPAGNAVVLQGFTVTGGTGGDSSRALFLSDNAGSVRIERCSFVGSVGHPSAGRRDGWDGARVSACADVSFARCVLRGGLGSAGWVGYPPDEPGTGGVGLLATQSTISAHDTLIAGGDGQDGGGSSGGDGGNGGTGCELDRSTLFASKCTFQAGDGGSGDCWSSGGEVSFALDLQAPGNLARIQGCLESGGFGGCDYSGFHCIPSCPSGPSPARAGGPFEDLPSQPRRLNTISPVPEGNIVSLEIYGQPGDVVHLFVSGAPMADYRPNWEGVLLVRPRQPQGTMLIGTVPPTGSFNAYLSLGNLGPGIESIRRYLQPIFTDVQGNQRLGSPSTMVILDSAF